MFLFCDKGQPPISDRGLIYDLDDFDDCYFVGEWYGRYNRLGDGCEVDFPMQPLLPQVDKAGLFKGT